MQHETTQQQWQFTVLRLQQSARRATFCHSDMHHAITPQVST